MMLRHPTLVFALMLLSCGPWGCSSSGSGSRPEKDATDASEVAVLEDLVEPRGDAFDLTLGDCEGDATGPADAWVFVRDNYETVHGWILLDNDPVAVSESIRAAADYGVNHIQLSHDLIMNVEDILGDDEAIAVRRKTLNDAIELGHELGMKVFVWTHEWSGVDPDICYDPQDAVWLGRAEAYRQLFTLLPSLDGVVLMFGSAPFPPWLTFCSCEWCSQNYPDLSVLTAPPPEERLEAVTQQVGEVVVNELGRELLVRTFVHEPAEIEWHSKGLAAVRGVDFTGMHKGPVQDWQPYNPHHPCTGNIGEHPSVMELDLAGEYYGLSELPFCAPGYYRYRMQYLWEHKGIGVVSRVQRGTHHALGTPNEINLLTVRRLLQDMDMPLDDIWLEFLTAHYGVIPGTEAFAILKKILEDTFAIRLKSHYVLGIWALEKGSGLPDNWTMDEFNGRGKMPKWDAAWTEHWNHMNEPDEAVVRWIWQEGNEAVDLARSSETLLAGIAGELEPGKALTLALQLTHQRLAAEAWRDIDLMMWSRKVLKGASEGELWDWYCWAALDLERLKQEMVAEGLSGLAVASPEQVGDFLSTAVPDWTVLKQGTSSPPSWFSPVTVVAVSESAVSVAFSANVDSEVFLEWGSTLPDYEFSRSVGVLEPGAERVETIDGLASGKRILVRLRTESPTVGEIRGGEFWVFVP